VIVQCSKPEVVAFFLTVQWTRICSIFCDCAVQYARICSIFFCDCAVSKPEVVAFFLLCSGLEYVVYFVIVQCNMPESVAFFCDCAEK
jgi:hypothetical protein